MDSVSFNDFQLTNSWKIDVDGPKWYETNVPSRLIDETTGKSYWNESKGTVRIKCFLLTAGTPVVHAIASAFNIAYRIAKLVSLSHFWWKKDDEKTYSLKERVKDAGIDLARIVVTPFAIVGLELSAIYGLFRPYDGRKLYASIERFQYETPILAPCFQPNPTRHAFGGDPNKQNAY